MTEPTIFVSIGNSDDELSQAEWATYYRDCDLGIRSAAKAVHGAWASDPTAPWQNACWAFSVDSYAISKDLQLALAIHAKRWRQNSIMWAEAVPVFLEPAKSVKQ